MFVKVQTNSLRICLGTVATMVSPEQIRITPEGVDGSGPLYEQVAAIADDWLKEHGLA